MQIESSTMLRGKKMVGALGRVPMPKELRERFGEKGVDLSLGEARSMSSQLKYWWVGRETSAPKQQKSTRSYFTY